MAILTEIQDPAVWQDFLAQKLAQANLTASEASWLTDFVQHQEYLPVLAQIQANDYRLSIPEKRLLNRLGKAKKRVVYTFSPPENAILKLISFLLYRYDNLLPANCYAFRREVGAKQAIARLTSFVGIDALYSCKIDIQDYFNSIDVPRLLPLLRRVLADDPPLYEFFQQLLQTDQAWFQGELVTEKRGAMAGVPVSQFFANLYLLDLDRQFEESGQLYARYSDDIICFAADETAIHAAYQLIVEKLAESQLVVNPEKTRFSQPGQSWEYLGIRYEQGRVRLAAATLQKAKGKIRRKARSIRRWQQRKGAPMEKAISVFCRSLNRKFYGRAGEDGFCWTRWFFPLLSDGDDLQTLDHYIQDYLRYLACGHFRKSNYRWRYAQLKTGGYQNLVHAYYQYRDLRRTK